VSAVFSLAACSKKKDECKALYELAGEHRKKYKKELDSDDADKSATRTRVVKALKDATDELSDAKVSAPKAKKARDQYVEDLDTMRTMLDDSVSEEKQEKAKAKLETQNSDADYFAIGVACEDMSIVDEF